MAKEDPWVDIKQVSQRKGKGSAKQQAASGKNNSGKQKNQQQNSKQQKQANTAAVNNFNIVLGGGNSGNQPSNAQNSQNNSSNQFGGDQHGQQGPTGSSGDHQNHQDGGNYHDSNYFHDNHSHRDKKKRNILQPAKVAVMRGAYCFIAAGLANIVLGTFYKSPSLPLARKTQSKDSLVADAILLGGFCSSKLGGCFSFGDLAAAQVSNPVFGAYLAGLDRIWTLQIAVGVMGLLTGLVLSFIGCGEQNDDKISIWLPVRVGLAYGSAAGILCMTSLQIIIASTAYFRFGYKEAIGAIRPFIGILSLVFICVGCFFIRPVKEGSLAHAFTSDDFDHGKNHGYSGHRGHGYGGSSSSSSSSSSSDSESDDEHMTFAQRQERHRQKMRYNQTKHNLKIQHIKAKAGLY